MKKNLLIASLIILSLVTPSFAQRRSRRAAPPDNGCDLHFGGALASRKPVKMRPANLRYEFNNGGRAISVADWFATVCTFDADVPSTKSSIPKDKPMNMEKLKVKVRAFVMAFKLDPDNDLHVQIADNARPYNQTQLIVEIPPGADYCEARTNMMELMRADGGRRRSGNYIFRTPPLVEVTGYVFIDAFHIRKGSSDYCSDNGGRGIKNGLRKSPVRGLWEIHPVIELKSVRQ
jgi:hypothetical protein